MRDSENWPKNKDRAPTSSREIFLAGPILAQMEAHTRTAEGEVCGLLYQNRYVPLTNLSSVDNRFEADPVELARSLHNFGEPLAVFHSHTNGNLDLSVRDLELCYYTNSTMIIGSIVSSQFRWKVHGNGRD
jgi:proteasome lid subunit RPN8/RPN11